MLENSKERDTKLKIYNIHKTNIEDKKVHKLETITNKQYIIYIRNKIYLFSNVCHGIIETIILINDNNIIIKHYT